MNLQQLRYVQEAVRRDLNLTNTAKALHTSQPGISKAILELEEELGIDIFARHGRRLRRLTEPGQQVLAAIEIILREVANLRRIGEEHSLQDAGTLTLAATRLQARHQLPAAVTALRARHPRVQVMLHQGSAEQVARLVRDEVADLGLATELPADADELVTLPCLDWQHVVIVPPEHALAAAAPTLEQLAAEPLATYQRGVSGRARIDAAFAQARLQPKVVLDAQDDEVIKTWVRLGLGVGIVAELALRDDAAGLVVHPAGALFGANVARVLLRRGAYLRRFVYTFAELLSDRLSRALIEQAMSGGDTYDI